ncbi:polysaccharide export protein [Aliikangiella marina]|uniref:Polysaccharide export protein n=1 Tax=Aliikangiella marina TaxID=1712262 RepID=A0A545T989_9GAMM|nr:polysaccharide biosynthesis/export family protein [Aliikangiella marina]TQV73783.1 polysaccharide export protein [Aliikangiella marina]
MNSRVLLLIVLGLVSGCSNLGTVTYQSLPEKEYKEVELAAMIANIQKPQRPKTMNIVTGPMTISPGDRIIVDISQDEYFNGVYEVNLDGTLSLPFVSPLLVIGKTIHQIERELTQHLINENILKRSNAVVSARIQQWSAIRVLVSGAVFSPGAVLINNRSIEHKSYLQKHKNGDAPFSRYLTTAILSAGGVRPDADLTRVTVIRNGKPISLDITGVVDGSQFQDLALVAGDQVVIPSLGMTQNSLMRPSPITPPGFQIFISNLSTPADNNAGAAIGELSRSIPFGTRLLRGLISANCVGGTVSTNASRVAILVSTDPFTGQTRVIQRSIEELVRNHNRDDFNPYLMPNDGIACYDSNVTNVRDVARSLSDIFNPLSILSNIGKED